jgi:hypothetical protein
MTDVSALGIARVLAEDIAGGNTLRMDNFDHADASTVSGAFGNLLTGVATLYVSLRTSDGTKTFQVDVTETNRT